MDRELLAQHHEGLIVLSGCPSGEVLAARPRRPLRRGREGRALLPRGLRDDYYLEIQDHGIAELEPRCKPGLLAPG